MCTILISYSHIYEHFLSVQITILQITLHNIFKQRGRYNIRHVYKSICCTPVQKEVNLSSLHHKEEKEMAQLFHINIHIMKTKVDALLDSTSQYNLIEAH